VDRVRRGGCGRIRSRSGLQSCHLRVEDMTRSYEAVPRDREIGESIFRYRW